MSAFLRLAALLAFVPFIVAAPSATDCTGTISSLDDVDLDALSRQLGDEASVDVRTLKELERALRDSGVMERGTDGNLRLTPKGWEAVGEMPLLGRIAAGRGLEAVVQGDEAYSLAGELLGSGSRYLLRVVGQSMIGAHIADGDLLVVEPDDPLGEGFLLFQTEAE